MANIGGADSTVKSGRAVVEMRQHGSTFAMLIDMNAGHRHAASVLDLRIQGHAIVCNGQLLPVHEHAREMDITFKKLGVILAPALWIQKQRKAHRGHACRFHEIATGETA